MSGEPDRRRNWLTRRSVLAVPVTIGLGSCIGDDDEPEPSPPPDPPDTVVEPDEPPEMDRPAVEELHSVNLVEQGADPTGETGIADVIETHADDDMLLLFPNGTYRLDREFSVGGLSNFGLVGDGATITIGPDFSDSVVFTLGSSGSDACENVIVDGLRYDFSEPGAGVGCLRSYCNGYVHIEDVQVEGRIESSNAAGRNLALRLREGYQGLGRARIHNVRFPDGGTNAGMWLSGQTERCQIHVTDSYVANFEDNGFYANTGEGEQLFERCQARNNSISNFRLGGVVRDSTVIVDDEFTHSPARPRGYWLRSRPTRVENCTYLNTAHDELGVEILDTDCVIDGLRLEVSGTAGGTTVRVHDAGPHETTIRNLHLNTTDIEAGRLMDVDNDRTSVSNLTIRTDADGFPVRVNGANGVEFTGIDVHATNADSRPFWFSDESASGATLRDSRIDVAGAEHDVRVDMPDVSIESTDAEVYFDESRNGVRGTIDGFGTNDGDPNEAGAWNGNGTPGIIVEDTESGELYVRTDDEWRQFE